MLLLLACAMPLQAPAQAPPAKRVAYLSTLAEKEAGARIAAVAERVDARWPASARPGAVKVEYRTFRYELPAARASATEPEAERTRRNEEIRERNDQRIAEMMAWTPDVVFAPGALPAKAAAKANATVPVVFGCKCNPLPDGWDLVKDPTRPERNLTGFTRYHIEMVGEEGPRRLNLHRKRIELLQKASAKPVRRIGAIYGDDYDENKWRYAEAARDLGVEWVKVKLTESSIEGLAARLRESQVDAGLVLADTFLDKFSSRLVKAAALTPLPVIFPWDEADTGAWMHYGTVVDVPDKAAEYIVNLLQGRKVADYPVEFPKQMELAVNFRTAKAHHWDFPRNFLLLVDRVIE
ncbi:MAG: ABC transporter substrate binding protein [Usitatibacter sp.]